MGGVVDRLGMLLLDGAVATTLLVGLVALGMIACGQPARRLFLARGAILASLAVVPLAAFAPIPRFPLAEPMFALAPPAEAGRGADEPRPPRPGPLRPRWTRGLVLTSLIGTTSGLIWLALGWLGTVRLVAGTVEASPESLAVFDALPFRGPARRPRLRVTPRLARPVLLGFVRPIILIPTDLDQPDASGPLRLGLLHELAHAGRLDPLFATMGALAQALWFFVPPVWWVRRQMRLDAEFLADRLATDGFGPAVSYASGLVGMAAPDGVANPAPTLLPGPPSAGSALFQRVLMLVRCPFPVEPRPPWAWRLLMVPILTGGTVLASGITLRGIATSFHQCFGGGPRHDHGRFTIARLSLHPPQPGPDGQVRPFTLVPHLPDRFELTVNVWAARADLPQIALAGRWLGPAEVEPEDAAGEESFHEVRLVREGAGLALWVDGRLVPPGPRDLPPTPFLTVQSAPPHSVRLRDLTLVW